MYQSTTDGASPKEGEYDCVICGDTLVDPRTLDCQHSFCLKCIYRIIHKDRDVGVVIKCPFNCLKQTITEGDVRSLPKNVKIDVITKQLRLSQLAKTSSSFSDGATASFSCTWCGNECKTPDGSTVPTESYSSDDDTLCHSCVCSKCQSVVCEMCEIDPEGSDHAFLCSLAPKEYRKEGWEAFLVYDFYLSPYNAMEYVSEVVKKKFSQFSVSETDTVCFPIYLEAREAEYRMEGKLDGTLVERLYTEIQLMAGRNLSSMVELEQPNPEISGLLEKLIPLITKNTLPSPPPYHAKDLFLLAETLKTIKIITWTVLPSLNVILNNMTKVLCIDIQAADVPDCGFILAVCHTIRSLVRECIAPAVHRILLIANAISGAFDERLIQVSNQVPSQAENSKDVLLSRAKQSLKLNKDIQEALREMKVWEEMLFKEIGNSATKIKQKISATNTAAILWQQKGTDIETHTRNARKERPSLLDINSISEELKDHSNVVWDSACTLLMYVARNLGSALDASHKSPQDKRSAFQQEAVVVSNAANLATCLGSLQQLMLTWKRTELSLFHVDELGKDPSLSSIQSRSTRSSFTSLLECYPDMRNLMFSKDKQDRSRVRLALLTHIIDSVCRAPSDELRTFDSLSKDFAESLFPQMLEIRSQHLAMLLKGGGIARYRLLQDQMSALSVSSLDLFYRQTILYVTALVASEGEQLLLCTHALCDVMEQQAGIASSPRNKTTDGRARSSPPSDDNDEASKRLEILSNKLQAGSSTFIEACSPITLSHLQSLESVQTIYTYHVKCLRGQGGGKYPRLSNFEPAGIRLGHLHADSTLNQKVAAATAKQLMCLPKVMLGDRLTYYGSPWSQGTHLPSTSQFRTLVKMISGQNERMSKSFIEDFPGVTEVAHHLTKLPTEQDNLRKLLLPFYIGALTVTDPLSGRSFKAEYLASAQHGDLMFINYPQAPFLQRVASTAAHVLSSRLFFVATNACMLTTIGIRALIRSRQKSLK